MAPEHLITYNPAFLSEVELVRRFIVREVDLELLIETIRENTARSNQHVLVIGPRGMGKTTLALRAVAAVRADSVLSKVWFPIVFSEESYEIGTPGEFWLEALFHLGRQTGDERWNQIYRSLKSEHDEQRLFDRALAYLVDFADSRKQRLLLVVENLNMILGQQIKPQDSWMLRHTLQNEPRIMLLATATSRFEETENIDRAMYELFRLQVLRPLDIDECRRLWHGLRGELLEGDRIRPIQILTGGNPRLMAILSSFAAGSSLHALFNDLARLIDEHTSYFKTNLEALPVGERKVFVALADIWRPAFAREVAESARMDVNRVSMELGRLVLRGAVSVPEQRGRAKRYQVTERLYNIYHLMRRGAQSTSPVRFVVDFMFAFYEPSALVEKTVALATEACALDLKRRSDYFLTYSAILSEMANPQLQERLVKSTERRFFELPGLPDALRAVVKRVSRKARRSTRSIAELRKALRLKQGDWALWFELGQQLEEKRRLGDAADAYRAAMRCQHAHFQVWATLGVMLITQNKAEEAEEVFRDLVHRWPESADGWFSLGACLVQKGALAERIVAFQRAIELWPADQRQKARASVWTSLGGSFLELRRHDEAEKALHEAICLQPEDATAWRSMAAVLRMFPGRHAEEEKALRRVVDLAPGDPEGWAALGRHLHRRGRFAEAAEMFQRAVELNSSVASYHFGLGLAAVHLKDMERAEQALRTTVQLAPEAPDAGTLLVMLLARSGRIDEAKAAIRQVTSLAADLPALRFPVALALLFTGEDVESASQILADRLFGAEHDILFGEDRSEWCILVGGLLRRAKKIAAAEAVYRSALERGWGTPRLLTELGALLVEEDRFGEAEEALEIAVSGEPSDADAWFFLALARIALGKQQTAEQAIRKAVELRPERDGGWAVLGSILADRGRRSEAQDAYTKAIELNPRNEWARTNRVAWRLVEGSWEGALKEAEEVVGDFDAAGETLAGILIAKKERSGLAAAERWMRQTIERHPERLLSRWVLAEVLGALDRWSDALAEMKLVVANVDLAAAKAGAITELVIGAAVAGHSVAVLQVLEGSPAEPALLPLVAALQLDAGHDANVPAEVLEVAKDIVKRIRERRAKRSAA